MANWVLATVYCMGLAGGIALWAIPASMRATSWYHGFLYFFATVGLLWFCWVGIAISAAWTWGLLGD
jgi:hypothetical protein